MFAHRRNSNSRLAHITRSFCHQEPSFCHVERSRDISGSCPFPIRARFLAADPTTTSRTVAECSRVLNINKPRVIAERVSLRPFRKSGVRLEWDRLRDGRTVIHNYGHGGAGFTLSWGCAREVIDLAAHAAT